jgi:hypothetical protein
MRAAVMHKAGDVRIETVPDAGLKQPTDAVVRVSRACICGSDLWPYKLGPAPDGQRMGHEAIGIVEDVGKDVRRIKRGDLVIMPFACSDGTCDFCHEGLQTACVHVGFFGTGGEMDGAYVFPGLRAGKPLSNMAFLMLLRRMGRGDLTAHGFRSTFRDWAAELTAFPSEVVEMALAHALGDKVEAAYRRGDLFDKRRRVLDAWAEYCASPAAPTGSVIPLRQA